MFILGDAMETVFTYIKNPREQQILEVLLEGYGFKVVSGNHHQSTFIQIMQYLPQYVIIELPQQFTNHLSLVRQIKSNRKTREIKILCYGDHDDTMNLNIIENSGVSDYLVRPLATEKVRAFLETREQTDLSSMEEAKYQGEIEDSAILLDQKTPTVKRIAVMVKRIGDLLAFPFTVAKVISVTESETTGAKELAQAIELDPVVVSNVLKVANSVQYGKVGGSITSIKDAIIRLGFEETKNISISLSVMKIFSSEVRSVGFNREQFWYHSLAVSVIAGKLARRAGYPHPEIAFVCGLLHDFGIILLDEFFPTYLQKSLHATTELETSFPLAQKELWGMTHNDVVLKLFTQWHMPPEVLTVIQKFTDFTSYENSEDKNMEKLVWIIGIADMMAKSLSMGQECDELVTVISNKTFQDLRCPTIKDEFYEEVCTEINKFSAYLNLKSETFTFKRTIKEADYQYSAILLDMKVLTFNPFEFYLLANWVELFRTANVTDIVEGEHPSDVMVILCQDETTSLELKSLLETPRQKPNTFGLQDSESTEEKSFLPTIIIGGAITESETLPSHVLHLPETIDLRILTFSIELLLLGHTMETYTHKEEYNYSASAPKEPPPPTQPLSKLKLQFHTEIVNRQILIISLTGVISKDTTSELKQIISMVLNKTKFICINLSEAEEVEDDIIMALDGFRKALQSRGSILTICNLGQPNYNPLMPAAEAKIIRFVDKTHLVNHINSVISQIRNLPKE